MPLQIFFDEFLGKHVRFCLEGIVGIKDFDRHCGGFVVIGELCCRQHDHNIDGVDTPRIVVV